MSNVVAVATVEAAKEIKEPSPATTVSKDEESAAEAGTVRADKSSIQKSVETKIKQRTQFFKLKSSQIQKGTTPKKKYLEKVLEPSWTTGNKKRPID